jgi:geranylgeranyl diphosphate synthase, type II
MLATTDNLVKQINTSLSKHSFGKEPKELYEPIEYMLALGGKRLRPLLSIMSYMIFKEDYEKTIKPSLALEVFHNFTLMHDDIMDKAPLRRGQATVHHKWNSNIAILSGDVMLVKAYDFLVDLEPELLKKVIVLFNQCATEVCEGQQLDMNFESRSDVTVDEYLNMIRLKTAVLLGFSMQLGGVLAGANKTDCINLYQAGVDIGIGFQLKDDLLDTFGDAEKFGKKVGGDIASNKKTYLLIRALELAKGKDLQELKSLLAGESTAAKITSISALYKKLKVDQEAETQIQLHFDRGLEHLQKVKGSLFRRGALKTFIQQLIEREN